MASNRRIYLLHIYSWNINIYIHIYPAATKTGFILIFHLKCICMYVYLLQTEVLSVFYFFIMICIIIIQTSSLSHAHIYPYTYPCTHMLYAFAFNTSEKLCWKHNLKRKKKFYVVFLHFNRLIYSKKFLLLESRAFATSPPSSSRDFALSANISE